VLARVVTFALVGVEALEVTVEADIHPGLPAFTIVGLPDAAVQESRERVRAALVNSGFEFPLRRITVNLAPADVRKAGPAFDLALAVADASRRARRSGLVVPRASAPEASLVEELDVVGVETLSALAVFLAGGERPSRIAVDSTALLGRPPDDGLDLAQVRGHHALKRALEVAAAGGHNLLMVGPPGSGKSMAARRLPSIMSPLTLEEALEVTQVHSVAGLLGGAPLVARRPFRAPHHTISSAGLVGGGPGPSPGEASLAHHGVLFLDELGEFSRPALEALRQPLEEGRVRITRSQRSVAFPARFMLVAATNPCPCGYAGDARRTCACHNAALHRYATKLSGPLLDRIDMIVRVDSPTRAELTAPGETQESPEVRARVAAARSRQRARLGGARCNGDMAPAQVRSLCRLDRAARATLYAAHERMALSVRGHDRVLRVARTLADLEGRDVIVRSDVAQAIAYREDSPLEALAVAG
jgi:magnesium chelatase family protein